MSMSMRPTRPGLPRSDRTWAMEHARLTANVLLPTPPLPEAMAIDLRIPLGHPAPAPAAPGAWGWARGPPRPDGYLHHGTGDPRHRAQAPLDLVLELLRDLRVVCRDRQGDPGDPPLKPGRLDQPERDDVPAEPGILHLPELFHYVFGRHAADKSC